MLHLQDEFGFDDQLIVEVYPNFIAEKHDIENAQINKTLCLGRKDGLFYDPIVEPMPSDVTYPELHASYSYSELPLPIDGNSSALSTFLSNLHKQTDISFKDFQIFLDLLNHPSFQCSKRDVDHFVSVYHQSIADASTPKSSKYVTELYPSATSNKGPNHIQICLVFTFKMLISKGSFDFPPQFTSILQYFHDICFEPAIPSQTLLQQRAGLTAFLVSSGLIPSALAKKLYKNNAGNNIPLSAFSELIPLENKFRWIKLAFKDPTSELIELMKPIITSKSYLQNSNHRVLLQNCCNLLRSFEKLMPTLKDYSDYVALDHRAIWLELAKYFPSGMPAQLDVTDQDALQLFIKAKWWMADNGGYQNSSNHRNEICQKIRCLSVKTYKTAMELLMYLILHLRATHINSPETIARAHGCKEILESYTDALPELYWVMSKLYEGNLIKGTSRFKSQKDYVNEKLELFERKTLSKGLVFENFFPLINYVLLKRKGPIAGVKQSIISSNLNHTIGLKFLIWLENFILLNLQGIFGINESVIKNIYPDALAQKEQLIEEQNKNILCLGKEDGLFYNPLPDLKFDPNLIVKQTPPTAPPMSIAPSRVSSPTRSRSASISEPEQDPHAIVADDLIAKLKAIPDQKDDDNDLEIDEPTVSDVQIASPALITEASSSVIVADAHPISSTEVVVDDEPAALPNFPQPSTDAPEDQYPKVADDELLAPKRIAVAVCSTVQNSDHKPIAKTLPFFASANVHKEETQSDASNINLDAFKTTQEKLNYIKATFEQETTNLHYLTKVTGHDTNAITQKILITLNGLFAWKVRLENDLEIATKQSATNSIEI